MVDRMEQTETRLTDILRAALQHQMQLEPIE